MKQKIYNLLLLIFAFLPMEAQELLPFVENYSKSNYQGDNQIWCVAQGNDKAMYFANNHYLVRYDGVKWEKYTLPNKTIIRSIMVDGNRIYSGSYKEFGYWYRKEGKMYYVSITNTKKIFDENENEEIWKIFKFNSTICFQSFNEMLLFDGKKIKKQKFPFLISYCFIVDNELLVASVSKGVFTLKNDKFIKHSGWSLVENSVIHSIQKHKKNSYVFTQKNGVFVENQGVLIPWKNSLNKLLKTANINVAKFIKNEKLIIGTATKGLFIYDFKSNTYTNINRNNVLMNNSVLNIEQDKENNLWLGLDNGIAHIEVNSPISIFYDNSGILGSVYSVASISNGYLMASNHGLFKYENKQLQLVPKTQGQAWNICKINDKYIIGHSEGTFIYENGHLTLLNKVNGGWNFTKSSISDLYLEGTYSGALVYKNSSDLTQMEAVKNLVKPIKYIAQNKKNEIWAADNYRGLYRVVYNDQFETIKIENSTQKFKIKNDFGVRIFEFRNEILFLIQNTWYTFNSITNQFVKNELFNSNFKNVSDVVTIDSNHFLLLQEGLLYVIYAVENKFIRNRVHEKYYKGKIINDNLKVFREKNNFLLNLDDGFISLQLQYPKTQTAKVVVEAFNSDGIVSNNEKINFNSEIKLYIISGVYGIEKPNLSYRLNDSNKILPVKEGLIVLNNLSSGSHEVTIYSFDGIQYKKIKDFEFEVAKPWYFSFWMVLLYLILIATISFIYYRWTKIRYYQKLKLREEELKHQREIVEMELKTQNELNSKQYEKHILELEIQSKSSEVAGKSLSIAKQSEMIDNIQAILETELDFNRLKNEIRKAIKINAINKHEWEIFETNLNQIHNEFIVNLSKKFKNLTPKDIKLCVYLKMNLSSKEIAPLMNISFRGVELHRYRLRKKIGLAQDENLTKFLLNI